MIFKKYKSLLKRHVQHCKNSLYISDIFNCIVMNECLPSLLLSLVFGRYRQARGLRTGRSCYLGKVEAPSHLFSHRETPKKSGARCLLVLESTNKVGKIAEKACVRWTLYQGEVILKRFSTILLVIEVEWVICIILSLCRSVKVCPLCFVQVGHRAPLEAPQS